MRKFYFILFVLFSTVVSAQTVESSRFFDNWSVGLKGGGVIPVKYSKFPGSTRAVMGLDLRKEITPIFGVGVEGEWSINTSGWERFPHSAYTFDHQLVGGYGAVNLMNAIGGYKGTPRLFEVELVAGLGWLHSYMSGGGDTNSWYTKYGVNLNFNVGKQKAWVLGIKPDIVFDMTEGMETNFRARRLYAELQLGVAYRFKNHNQTHSFVLCDKVATQAEVDELNGKINALREEVQAIRKRHHDRKPEKIEVIKEVRVMDTRIANAVGFDINSDLVKGTEFANLSNVATWLKENKDTNVEIVAYADAETGTPEYNQALSVRRAENVKKVLVNVFGIEESRLTTTGLGSSEQPYGTNDWNRVVIFKKK